MIAVIAIAFVVLVGVFSLFASKSSSSLRFSTGDNRNVPSVHVDIHTHNRSKNRLEMCERSFLKGRFFKSNAISTLAVVPKNFSFESSTPMLITKCGGKKAGASDFVCRVQAGHDNFLDNYPQKNWFIRAIDDTWIDDENLMRYISQLETFIDPRKHIVAKATRNNCVASHPFLHGGAGWLVSRALLQFLRDSNVTLQKLTPLAFQHQDDTAMSVVLWKLFPKFEYWDDFHIISPLHLQMDDEYSKLRQCSKQCKLVRANDVFLIHLLSWSDHTASFAENLHRIPRDVLICRIDEGMNFCKANETEAKIDSFDIDWLKSTTPILTAENYRKTFIDAQDIVKIKVLKTAVSNQKDVTELPISNLLNDPLDPNYKYGDRLIWDGSERRFRMSSK